MYFQLLDPLSSTPRVHSLRELGRHLLYKTAIGDVVSFGHWRVYRSETMLHAVNLQTRANRAQPYNPDGIKMLTAFIAEYEQGAA